MLTHFLVKIILIADMVDTKVTQFPNLKGILFRVLPHTEPVFTVKSAAAQRGVVKEGMVKSILLIERRKNRFVTACVTGVHGLTPKQ